MDKRFKNIILLFIAGIFLLPMLLNFLILYINFIPSVGNNTIMLQAYTSFLGGAIGGLATLITIYYAIIKVREEHKPLLYFNNTRVYFYKNGLNSVFSRKLYNTDEDISEQQEKIISFQLDNIGLYPALDVKIKIINLADFIRSAELLKINKDEVKKLKEKSYSLDYVREYPTRSLLKQGEDVRIKTSIHDIFGDLLIRLIYYYEKNIETDKQANNNHAVSGRFKLYDIKIEYKSINNNYYFDIFTLYVSISPTLQLDSDLSSYKPWVIDNL